MIVGLLRSFRSSQSLPAIVPVTRNIKSNVQILVKENGLIPFQGCQIADFHCDNRPPDHVVSYAQQFRQNSIDISGPEVVYFWDKLKQCFGSKKGDKKKKGKKAKKQSCKKKKCGKQKDTCLKKKESCEKPSEKKELCKTDGKKDDKKDVCKKKDEQKEDPCKKKEEKKADGDKKQDPCKKKEEKKEDPCKKKEDPCKKKDVKKEDPCKKKEEKKEDPCKKKEEKKEDPCKKKEEKKEDPCKKKEDPCKKKEVKKEDPCKKKEVKKEDPCKKKEEKKEDPCKKKDDPCKKKEEKKEDPCKKKEDPCKKKDDPCKKKEEKKEDPCKKKDEKKEDPCKKKDEKKEDPCKKKDEKKEDPCKKKEDPCKKKDEKKEDPCKKKEDPCKKKEDPCKKKEDPCKKKDEKKEDPCKKKEDPCKKKEDPCKKKDEKKEDPCEPCKKKDDPCKKKEDPCKKKDPCAKFVPDGLGFQEPFVFFVRSNAIGKKEEERCSKPCRDPCADGNCDVVPGQDEPCSAAASWKIKVRPCRRSSPCQSKREGNSPSGPCIIDKVEIVEQKLEPDDKCGLTKHPCGKKVCPNKCEVKRKTKFSDIQEEPQVAVRNLLDVLSYQTQAFQSTHTLNFANARSPVPPSKAPDPRKPAVGQGAPGTGSPVAQNYSEKVAGLLEKLKGLWQGSASNPVEGNPQIKTDKAHRPQPLPRTTGKRLFGMLESEAAITAGGFSQSVSAAASLESLSAGDDSHILFMTDDFEKCEDRLPPCPLEPETMSCPAQIEECIKTNDDIWSDIDANWGYERFPWKTNVIKEQRLDEVSQKSDDPFANNQL